MSLLPSVYEFVNMDDVGILLFGTLGMTLMALAIVSFALLYQSKMKRKSEELGNIQELLQRTELQAIERYLSGQHQEKQRIAKELHDGVASELTVLRMKVANGNLQGIQIKKEIDQILGDIRGISHNLNNGMFSSDHLESVIEDYLNDISSNTGLEIALNHHGLANNSSDDLGKNLFRIIQELLQNALRHSEATKVTIDIHYYINEQLNLIYTDNGKGMKAQKKEGIGLSNIKKRVEALGGTFHIEPQPSQGVEIIIDCNLTLI